MFEPPEVLKQKDDFIKRVVGLPGDRIEVREGVLFVNDLPQEEPYLAEAPNYEFGPVTIPEGALFVMGDNRNESFDSHLWNGWLTVDHLKGEAFMIYWPVQHIRLFE